MRRIALVLALVTGIVIGFGVPVSGLGLISVTLTCSDGTSVTMNVDTDTLNSLTDSVNAMTLYPAGLTCTLVQNPVNPLRAFFGHVATAASGDKFLVGGGRWQVPCSAIVGGGSPPPPFPVAIPGGVIARVPPGALAYPSDPSALSTDPDVFIWVNIAVNAHLRDQTDPNSAYGSLNETIPANQPTCGTTQVGESHFTSQPTCLLVPPATTNPPVQPPAYVVSKVTQASDGSGQVPFPVPVLDVNGNVVGTNGVNVGEFVHFGFQDNGFPPGQNPTMSATPTTDMLNGVPASPEGTQGTPPTPPPCDPAQWFPSYHLGTNDNPTSVKQYGNLTLHQ